MMKIAILTTALLLSTGLQADSIYGGFAADPGLAQWASDSHAGAMPSSVKLVADKGIYGGFGANPDLAQWATESRPSAPHSGSSLLATNVAFKRLYGGFEPRSVTN